MAFDFPSNPIQDQEYTPPDSPTGATYVWKDPRWVIKGSGTSGSEAPIVDWENITNKPATFPPAVPIAQVDVTNLIADLALKAPLASPPLTGTPTTPTAAPGTNTTQIASTAFVKASLDSFNAFPEAPVDGKQYARKSAAWAEVLIPPTDWSAIPNRPATFPPTLPIPWTDVSGKPALYPPVVPIHWNDVSNKPATYPPTVPISWANVDGKPALYPPQVPIDWTNISNTPATYPPTLPIPWGNISGKPATFPPTLPIPQDGVVNLITDLAAKEPTIAGGTTSQFWRGDKTWQPLPPSGITDAPVDGKTYGRKDAAWAVVLGGASIADTAPAGAVHGQLWWNSANGNFYICYTDADTTQWVQINTVGS